MPQFNYEDPFRELHWSQIRRGWEGTHERNYWVPTCQIEGHLPEGLEGTLYRNGPGNSTNIWGTKPLHPVDGDGFVVSLTFQDGHVHLNSKFVRTDTRMEEQKSRVLQFPGKMGTRAVRDYRPVDALMALMGMSVDLGFRDSANRNVIYWGGKVVTTGDRHLPYSLDPRTLDTIGKDNFGGVLKLNDFASRFRIDHKKNRLCGFAIKPSAGMAHVHLYEFTRNWTATVNRREMVEGLNYANDFALTDTYYVFQMTPFVAVSSWYAFKSVAGLGTPSDAMGYQRNLPCKLVLIPRDVSKATIQINIDPCHIMYYTHISENAVRGTVDLGVISYGKDFQMKWDRQYAITNAINCPGEFQTLHVDTKTRVVGSIKSSPHTMEQCTRHPYRDGNQKIFWGKGNVRSSNISIPYRDLIKINMEDPDQQQIFHTWGVVSSICFAPKHGWLGRTDGNEDDGWLIVELYVPESHLTEFVIFDGRNIDEGPLCRVKLLHHLPYSLDCTWTHETFQQWSEKKPARRAKL